MGKRRCCVRNGKKLTAIMLAALMLVITACGSSSYGSYTIGEDSEGSSVFGMDTSEDSGDPGSIFGSGSSESEDSGDSESTSDSDSIFSRSDDDDGSFTINDGPNTAEQLTEADIQAMNGGNAIFVYSNEGYLSTLVGRFYDKKIAVKPGDMDTAEAAINSLNGIANLLGLQKGTDFFCVEMAQDGDKYTYITYQQRYGNSTIFNSTMHIVIDPEGYACAVSSSFTPGLGQSVQGEVVSAQTILDDLMQQYPTAHFYPEDTEEVTIWCAFTDTFEDCYVFFCDNDVISPSFEGMRYLALYISKDGATWYSVQPSATLTVTEDTSYYNNDQYFEGMQPATWSGTVDFFEGGRLDVTINVAYNPKDGLYYMMDTERKIAVVDYYEFFYDNWNMDFLTSTDNTWDERDIAAMYNYECAYDAYAKIGIKSPDGYESPILLTRKYCNENREGIANACYMAKYFGWYTFCYCEVMNISYDLDVVGHEFTHAVTEAAVLGNRYQNDAGAINESYSDVMGNIIEYMYNRTSDPTWRNGEMSDEASRSMSDPNLYYQPDELGGAYYVPNVEIPDININDAGGVHQNSGITNMAAYLIYEGGMDLDSMFDLYYTSLQILTPANSYEDVYAALIFSARANGYEEYEPLITKAFTDNNVLSDKTVDELMNEIPSGYGKVTFNIYEYGQNNMNFAVTVYDQNLKSMFYTHPDKNGVVSFIAREGVCALVLYIGNSLNSQLMGVYVYDGSTWQQAAMDGSDVFGPVYIYDGQITHVPDI